MSGQRHATMVAAASLALTLTPMLAVFEGIGWTIPILLVIAAVSSAGALARAWGRTQGLQTVAMLAALIVVLTAVFGGGTAIAFLVPTPGTFAHWLDLIATGINDVVVQAPPVAAEDGILFLTMAGVGIVAVLHDMFIVGLRTPALAGLTLLTMYLVPVSVAPDATHWFWFILPAVAYLWILGDDNLRRVSRFGHRFTGSGRLVGPRYPSPLASTARVTGALFVAFTLVLLAVIPTNTSGLVDQVSRGYGEGTGTGDGVGSLDPWARLEGQLRLPDPIDILRISTTDSSPRYLRMHVADQLSREGFSPARYDDLESVDELDVLGGGDVYEATVENLAMPDPVVPVYGNPFDLDIEGRWGVDPDTRVIASDGSTMSEVDTYTFKYTDQDWDAAALAAAEPLAPDDPIRQRNTTHPDVDRVSDIVEEVTAGAENDYEKVRAVMDYLAPSNGFSYSLETVDDGNESAVVDFLETQRGYCQQFAATMAWMLRDADVPARVALGLTRGSPDGDDWVVSSDNYHAWVEVYFQGSGWVVFDPTPSSGVADSVEFSWQDEPTDQPTTDPSQSASPAEGPTDNGAPTQDPMQNPTAEGIDPQAGGDAAGPTGPNRAWLALTLLVAIPFVPALWRSALRRSRLRPKRLNAQTAWDETLDLAADYGVDLDGSLTPRQAAAALAEAAPDAGAPASALASAMEFHRYSPRGADPTSLPDAVSDLRSALDRAADGRARLGARLWPASLATALMAERGRSSKRIEAIRSKVRWPRRSNARRDEAVTGRT